MFRDLFIALILTVQYCLFLFKISEDNRESATTTITIPCQGTQAWKQFSNLKTKSKETYKNMCYLEKGNNLVKPSSHSSQDQSINHIWERIETVTLVKVLNNRKSNCRKGIKYEDGFHFLTSVAQTESVHSQESKENWIY